MQGLTYIKFEENDQHSNVSKSRGTTRRGYFDGNTIILFDFKGSCGIEDVLVNLLTGEIADDTLGICQVQELNEKVVKKMAGQNVFHFSYQRKDRAIQVKTKSIVSI